MALFGTDGIRARAGEGPLAPDNVLRLGIAIGQLLRTRPDVFSTSLVKAPGTSAVLIGRDTRASGEAIEGQLTSGLIGTGNEVWSAGVIPTPGLAYLTRAWSCALGVMVSASHNPAEDNGIKLISTEGFKVPDEAEQALEKLLASDQLREPSDPATTVYGQIGNRVEEYLLFLRTQLDGSLRGMKIVVDCAHGAATNYAPKLLQSLGAQVVPVHTAPDGANINRNAGVLQPALLAEIVRRERATLGAAYDGDGDRCILVDERGDVLDGDQILAICSEELPPGRGIVSTVMANFGLETWLRERGRPLARTPVGDRWVADEMRRTGAVLGGEQSGHIIFLDASPTGDGMLTTMRVLRLMLRTGKSLSQLCAGFRKYPQMLVNVPVRHKPPLDTVPAIQRAIQEAERRMEGRVLVRYSGTESLCRVMVEGPDDDQVKRAAESLAAVVRQSLS